MTSTTSAMTDGINGFTGVAQSWIDASCWWMILVELT
jgi:hypothetical protein